ncbi:hypothetical protein QLQ12_36390 [Actinoplanes sp. NEAU-A12]|uniref:Uncharacterized protein n=1 Tax=Actinoplanes sandaracinus TaxID=3045177 RepID=A0ABT6WWJ2_9ACTN|nr:hypothetical protein [Actinoplanes sandaracinus]MDI6104085.1 hypothetical protein [Actinoplanes sandaracinus]
MTDEPRLAILCARLGADTDPVRAVPAVRSMADRVVARLRSGDPVLEDDFDEIEDELMRAGYAAGLSSTRIYRPLLGDGRPVLEFLACPGGRCSRVELPDAPAECAVFAAPMTRTRLAS